MAVREMGGVSLLDALDYLNLLAGQRPDRFDCAAIRSHARLETEAVSLTLAESQLALAALGTLRLDSEAVAVLRRLLGRAQPTSVRRLGSPASTGLARRMGHDRDHGRSRTVGLTPRGGRFS
jgi:hypothetical protein